MPREAFDDALFDDSSDEEDGASPLDSFIADGLITDVLGVVKSGKEATVYCCQAGPSVGVNLLAAKVYRAREHRGFKNDAVYQEGRVITDRRLRRAFENKSRKGREVQFSGWVEHEFQMLTRLDEAGADVPRVVGRSSSAILQEYVGDASSPAPMLSTVTLSSEAAPPLFHAIMRNIKLFLSCHCVHGDLSAFNILYHRGRVTIIDFPQAVDPRANHNAFALLQRDVENVCRYFQRYGVRANATQLAESLWRQYQHGNL